MLDALMRGFDRDSLGNGKRMRELLEDNRRQFYSSAIDLLRAPDESRGFRYLTALLVTNDLLLPALCDPALTRSQAMALARAALQVDAMADVTLARQLADSAVMADSPLTAADAARLMEILADISDGSRILPALAQLSRHPSPHVRSKAVLMIGRGNRNVNWVQSRLAEGDPRVRANAVESLWGVDTQSSRDLLRTAARDKNNRVAGNALVALYRVGDCSIIPDLMRLTNHESATFRATAAWVMGESGDPRFTAVLARMLGEQDASVRRRVFASLARIKTAVAQAQQAGEWRVAAFLSTDAPKEWRQVRVAVTSSTGECHANILPNQFILTEDGQPVVDYRVEEKPLADSNTIVFVLPASSDPAGDEWTRGAVRSLAWKRPADWLAALPYSPTREPIPESDLAKEEALHFSSKTDEVDAALAEPVSASAAADFWGALLRAVRATGGPGRGQRHLVVFSDAVPAGTPPDYAALLSAAVGTRTTVQAVATSSNPALEELCRRTGGDCQLVSPGREIPYLIERAYLRALARYTITYRPGFPDVQTLKTQIYTRNGWGEDVILIPAGD